MFDCFRYVEDHILESSWTCLGLDIASLLTVCLNFFTATSAMFVIYKYCKKHTKLSGKVPIFILIVLNISCSDSVLIFCSYSSFVLFLVYLLLLSVSPLHHPPPYEPILVGVSQSRNHPLWFHLFVSSCHNQRSQILLSRLGWIYGNSIVFFFIKAKLCTVSAVKLVIICDAVTVVSLFNYSVSL